MEREIICLIEQVVMLGELIVDGEMDTAVVLLVLHWCW